MMVTDDTLQDEKQVLAAKALLYREHLPEHVKKVHFVSDGAGCYKSKLHRTIMPCWETWTGIVELTYRITPAGDGKSVLDGMFARMNNCLATAVNEGGSHYDAETTIEMADAAGGMAATEFVRFAPDRSTNNACRMKKGNKRFWRPNNQNFDFKPFMFSLENNKF